MGDLLWYRAAPDRRVGAATAVLQGFIVPLCPMEILGDSGREAPLWQFSRDRLMRWFRCCAMCRPDQSRSVAATI